MILKRSAYFVVSSVVATKRGTFLRKSFDGFLGLNLERIIDAIDELLCFLVDVAQYLSDAFAFVVFAFVIGLIISLAGYWVNTYSFVISFLVFTLFLPITRWFDDLEEFLKRSIGFTIGVIVVSGLFFRDYWLTSAAIVGLCIALLREWVESTRSPW